MTSDSQTQTASLPGGEDTHPLCPCGIKLGEEWLREHDLHWHPVDQLTRDNWIDHPPFRWKGPTSENGAQMQFSLSSDPLDVKICHCDTCKKLHGAPMQTAAVFHKTDARLTKGDVGDIAFFSPSLPNSHMTPRPTPCPRKIYCAGCGSPLADEGKNMFLVYPSSLRRHKSLDTLGSEQEEANRHQEDMGKLPPAFNVVGGLIVFVDKPKVIVHVGLQRKHIFYGKRAFDMWDGIEKWEGLDGKSRRMADDGCMIE